MISYIKCISFGKCDVQNFCEYLSKCYPILQTSRKLKFRGCVPSPQTDRPSEKQATIPIGCFGALGRLRVCSNGESRPSQKAFAGPFRSAILFFDLTEDSSDVLWSPPAQDLEKLNHGLLNFSSHANQRIDQPLDQEEISWTRPGASRRPI